MTRLLLRPAGAGDAARVCDVFLRARAGMTYLPQLHTAKQTRAWIASVIADEQVTVVEATGAVRQSLVGFAAVSGDWLTNLYVDPNWQGRGIGGALLRTVVADRDRLQLWVFQRNSGAREFYERHGFVLREKTDGSHNEEKEPDARYERVAGET